MLPAVPLMLQMGFTTLSKPRSTQPQAVPSCLPASAKTLEHVHFVLWPCLSPQSSSNPFPQTSVGCLLARLPLVQLRFVAAEHVGPRGCHAPIHRPPPFLADMHSTSPQDAQELGQACS